MEGKDGEQGTRSKTRFELILRTGVEAFGQRGYAGSSLREIAASAGVSLSLLSHHFVSKPGLLQAVVESLQASTSPHLAALRTSLERATDVQQVVSAWVHYAWVSFGHPTGLPYLKLLLRLQSDPEVPRDVRRTLDASESSVRRRVKQLFPSATAEAIDLAWTATAGALYAAMIDAEYRQAADGPSPTKLLALERYLAGGLTALLAGARCEPALSHATFTSPVDEAGSVGCL